jgi:hypothetical protein
MPFALPGVLSGRSAWCYYVVCCHADLRLRLLAALLFDLNVGSPRTQSQQTCMLCRSAATGCCQQAVEQVVCHDIWAALDQSGGKAGHKVTTRWVTHWVLCCAEQA